MKSLSLLILFIISINCFAQSSTPQKNDNTIVITTSDSLQTAFNKLQMFLQDEGYAIEKSDKDLLTLQTDDKTIKKRPFSMYINAYVRENKIYLQGKYIFQGEESDVANIGQSGSLTKLCFEELQRVATAYPGGSLNYMKR